MKAMDFVVRPETGAARRGTVEAGAAVSVIEISAGEEISLNIRQFELKAYDRVGSDLHVTLADGRVIVLKGYFADDEGAVARLFISADGYLSEITLVEAGDGALFAQYGPTEAWGKWSPHEELVFVGNEELIAPAGDDDTVSMLGAGLLLGGGGIGAAGGLAALAAGSVVAGTLAGGGGGGGGGGAPQPAVAQPGGPVEQVPSGPRLPTVNERDPIILGGGDRPSIGISGTADPDALVQVTIGDKVLETRPTPDGDWRLVFEGGNFPADGTYPVVVVVTQPDGSLIDLSGPAVTIDTTPPVLNFTEGTVSAGHVVNAEDHRDGVDISGTSEPGARIAATIGTVTHAATANDQGQWSVRFMPGELPEGDYTRDVTVTATDAFNNSATFRDTVRVDTIPDPIEIRSWLVAGDGTVNRSEASGDLVVTGISTPGNILTLALFNGTETITRSVPVQGDGTWQVTYPAGSAGTGEHEATLTATTVDHAGNIGRATAAIRVDTLHHLTIDPAPLGAANVINADAADGGVILRGTTQPGSQVEVRFGSITRQADVAADGTWSARFAGGDFARAEYDASFDVTARDAAGNVDMASRTVRVDTVVDVSIDAGIGRNGLINDAVRQAGVDITGTTDPGAEVRVQVGNVVRQADVDGAGLWRVRFETADLPQGQGDLAVTATATDAAQNSSSAGRSVVLDTEVRDFGWTSTGVAADGIVNGADAGAGLFVTGQVEPGSRVMVTLGTVSHQALVLADGQWSARFAPSEISRGEYVTELRAVATDAAQNTSEIRQAVRVDTALNLLELAGPVTGDNMINLDEAKAGFAVTGQVEALPGVSGRSTVEVEFLGRFYQATVDGAGNWSAFIPGEAVPQGNHVVEMVVHARDAANNAGSLTQVLTIDTDLPTNPIVASYTRDAAGIRSVSIEMTGDQISLTEIAANGDMTPVENVATPIAPLGESLHSFGQITPGGGFAGGHLPDGSNLLITATDAAGNASGTFLAFDALTTSVIDLSAPIAAGSRIDAVDLSFAEDSSLTLTEAQILALSPDQRSLTVHGGSDDSLTLTGALRDGTEVVEGRNYAVYALGEARVIVDEDVRIL